MYVYLLVCLFIYSFEPGSHVIQVNLKLTESLRMTLKLCRGEALCSHILSPALQAGIHNASFMWEVGINPRVACMLGKHSSNLVTSLAETIYAFKLFYPDIDLPTNYKI